MSKPIEGIRYDLFWITYPGPNLDFRFVVGGDGGNFADLRQRLRQLHSVCQDEGLSGKAYFSFPVYPAPASDLCIALVRPLTDTARPGCELVATVVDTAGVEPKDFERLIKALLYVLDRGDPQNLFQRDAGRLDASRVMQLGKHSVSGDRLRSREIEIDEKETATEFLSFLCGLKNNGFTADKLLVAAGVPRVFPPNSEFHNVLYLGAPKPVKPGAVPRSDAVAPAEKLNSILAKLEPMSPSSKTIERLWQSVYHLANAFDRIENSKGSGTKSTLTPRQRSELLKLAASVEAAIRLATRNTTTDLRWVKADLAVWRDTYVPKQTGSGGSSYQFQPWHSAVVGIPLLIAILFFAKGCFMPADDKKSGGTGSKAEQSSTGGGPSYTQAVRDLLGQSRRRLDEGNALAAVSLADAALEMHLKSLAVKDGVDEENPRDINAKLSENDVYDEASRNSISRWLKLGDSVNAGQKPASNEEAQKMLDGVEDFVIKTS